jgi:hypothetical protein
MNMELEFLSETQLPPCNEIMRLEHQIRELKAEITVLRAKMEHARAILKSDQLTPEQEETKRLFNPSGLWNKYAHSKANY